MMVRTGLDILVREEFSRLRGLRIGVLCNQASVDANLDHILDLLLPFDRQGFLKVRAVFGPQHGLFGHTQDNMVEWEGSVDPRTGWRIFSLYGEHRKPTPEMLEGIDLFVVDLQDVGARYYTFMWTLDLCIQACAQSGIPVLVLDRPNPISGAQVEGTVLDPEYASFVGLRPLPMRHGMTIGELALSFGEAEVVTMEGWSREMYFSDTGLPWAMPSPNMPTPDTAIVYPGGCLVEGTNLSEGRGTTRPFEIVGAPFLDAHRFSETLNSERLPGVKFRPIEFQPTFQKHAGQLCGGCFIHVLDRQAFRPVLTFLALLRAAMLHGGERFRWKEPPYEYEYVRRPIDILMGNGWLADQLATLTSPEIRTHLDKELKLEKSWDRATLY